MKGWYSLRSLLCLIGSLWIVSTEAIPYIPQTGHAAANSRHLVNEATVHSKFFESKESSPREAELTKKQQLDDRAIGRYVAYRGGEFGGGDDDNSSDDNNSKKDKVAKSSSKLGKLSSLVKPLIFVGIGICIGLIEQQYLALSKDLETKLSNEALQGELAKLKELLLEELSGVHEILEYEIKTTQTKLRESLDAVNNKLKDYSLKTETESFAKEVQAKVVSFGSKVKGAEKRLGALEDTVNAVGNTMEAVESKVQQNSRSLHGLANEIERVSVKVTSNQVKDYYGQQQDNN